MQEKDRKIIESAKKGIEQINKEIENLEREKRMLEFLCQSLSEQDNIVLKSTSSKQYLIF